MFIPYRAGIKITRIPVMTIVVAVVCLLVYWAQARNENRIVASAKAFCTAELAADIEHGQKRYIHNDSPCWDVLAHTYLSGNPEAHLKWHREKIQAAGDPAAAETLVRVFQAFAAQAPAFLTERLVKYSGSWNPLRMLTAVVAHGSWDHLLGNLIFFVAFAMVVETVIGPVVFCSCFSPWRSQRRARDAAHRHREGGAALGLSGVVMGFMTLAAYFSPPVKITRSIFYFFFLFFGFLSCPLWSVAAWYVFWNIWDYLFWRDWVAIGFARTWPRHGPARRRDAVPREAPLVAERLVPDEPTLRDEESWLSGSMPSAPPRW
jgi:membrane associated rhomboid family serine protease